MIEISQKPLSGKKRVILGIANEHSIAYGCTQAFRALGADLAITYGTYGHDKSKPYVEPLARELEAPIFLPCDMQAPGHL
jgi:enoyl-[acyl-carrier protein] reductase I